MNRFILSFSSATFVLPSIAYAAEAGHANHYPSWVPEFLTHDATNVAFAAMVGFLLIVWRVGGFKAITSGLDKRAEAIETQLNEAKDLREAATKMLADAERQQKQADKDAEAIVTQAKKDAEALMKEAREGLAQRLDRREALAEARIQQAANEATAEVRRTAADAATKAAQSILANTSGTDQFEAAAKEIEKALN
jgi:F-type H+-transporting ATPase subunit b